jgi:hypothetical protein
MMLMLQEITQLVLYKVEKLFKILPERRGGLERVTEDVKMMLNVASVTTVLKEKCGKRF